MVGYTQVIQDGHRADQYPEVGLWEVISALSFEHGRITFYHGSSPLWNCSGLSFGRSFGAHLVHKTLQMGSFCSTERTLSDSKQMKRDVYEQGRDN